MLSARLENISSGSVQKKAVRELSSRIQAREGQAENLAYLSNNQFSFIKAVATQALDNGKQTNHLRDAVQEMAKAIQVLASTSTDLQFIARIIKLSVEMLTAI